MIAEYVRRLKGGSYRPLHPLLQEILKETYGIMVYQEDVAKVAIALAGFSAADADELRKVAVEKAQSEKTARFQAAFFCRCPGTRGGRRDL
jgi:DNA polymerase III alpha subunit